MAITINGVEYRNLQEQVQKNKEDIARHYEIDRVIADFGIRILGAVPTVADIPEAQYTYGDAYLVTNENTTYIWTRANPLIGQDVPYWLDVGNLSIPGPQGPQGATGPQGPQGLRGSLWYIGTATPITTNANANDMYLNVSTGIVYMFNGVSWVEYQTIKGPQGPQGATGPQGAKGPQGATGPQGAKGDAGGFINIAGIVENTNQLPNPSLLADLTKAYLVGTSLPYNLYIQVGDNSQTANWYNMGAFNTATLVNLNGSNENFINLTDSSTIIWDQNDLGDTTANLSASIVNDVTRSIKAPMSNPTTPSVPVVTPDGDISYLPYGQGNIVDNVLSSTSENPVQNKVIKAALDNKLDKIVSQGSFNRALTLTNKKGSTDIATIIIHSGSSGSNAFISTNSIAQRKGTALWAETPADDSTDAHNWDLINREHLNEKIAELGGGEWATLTLIGDDTNTLTANFTSSSNSRYFEICGWISTQESGDDRTAPIKIAINVILDDLGDAVSIDFDRNIVFSFVRDGSGTITGFSIICNNNSYVLRNVGNYSLLRIRTITI